MTDITHAEHSHAQHDHRHEPSQDEGHAYAPRAGALGLVWDTLVSLSGLHSHEHTREFDSALESNARGIRALKISLAAMMLTAIFQVAIAR